jgi:hypothetical protein
MIEIDGQLFIDFYAHQDTCGDLRKQLSGLRRSTRLQFGIVPAKYCDAKFLVVTLDGRELVREFLNAQDTRVLEEILSEVEAE